MSEELEPNEILEKYKNFKPSRSELIRGEELRMRNRVLALYNQPDKLRQFLNGKPLDEIL